MSLLNPLNRSLSTAQAIHLLRRTTFVNSWGTISKFSGLNSNEAVDLLINNASKPFKNQLPEWRDESFTNWWKKPADQRQAALQAIYDTLYKQNAQLTYWWQDVMAQDEASIREKMTLFWHGHFTTKYAIDQVMPAQLMFRQNMLFRSFHQGNLKELVKKVCIDGAMIIFLNSNDSTNKAPNENFSRELLELYTTGIGHYTENDVKEGARVFTGLRINYYSDEWTQIGVYNPFVNFPEHDQGEKYYLGMKINGQVYKNSDEILIGEIGELVDIIFQQKTRQVAEFICQKLFKFFVYSNEKNIDKGVIAEMATILISSNFEVKPVLSALFKSAFFLNAKVIGNQIKTPAENIVGITKHFNVKDDWKTWVMATMGQSLLNPPTVAGWPGYRKWVDTRTYPFAVQQMGYFVWNQTEDQMMEWVSQFSSKADVRQLIADISTLFLAKQPNAKTIETYRFALLQGAPDYEWPEILKNKATAVNRLKGMMVRMIKNPDFHLC